MGATAGTKQNPCCQAWHGPDEPDDYVQALLDQSGMDALLTYMMCQGNARELRQTADGLTFQHSTVQYHDRR